ncbi:MAG: hypothetical protein DME56_07160 [Verrucomicrobia bacterium]|nr:MAG: hypothetical protein DME56_07160 [Verrucomicrobiota bacterium]
MTRDYGHPALKEHLSNVIFLMRGCLDFDDFKMLLDKAAPKYDDMPIDEEELRLGTAYLPLPERE